MPYFRNSSTKMFCIDLDRRFGSSQCQNYFEGEIIGQNTNKSTH